MHQEGESVALFLSQRFHVLLGSELLSHDFVTHIFSAIEVNCCIVIFITIIILCTDEFVDLGQVTIFEWGLSYVEWFMLLLGSTCLYTAASRSQVCWVGYPVCPGKIVLWVP